MSTNALGRRYAKALFDLGEEKKQTDRILKDLDNFTSTWEQSDELSKLFSNPDLPRDAKKKVLVAVLDRLAAAPVVKSTLSLLADRNRLQHVPAVAAAFRALVEEQTGTVRAQVTTAKAMPDSYFAELQKALAQVTGKNVVLDKSEDPTLIAGVVARVGDKVFDGSVRTRLDELKEHLLAH